MLASRSFTRPLRPGGQKTHSGLERPDRKSTRLNSSHVEISYAVFCLKKKKKIQHRDNITTQTDDKNGKRTVWSLKYNASTTVRLPALCAAHQLTWKVYLRALLYTVS